MQWLFLFFVSRECMCVCVCVNASAEPSCMVLYFAGQQVKRKIKTPNSTKSFGELHDFSYRNVAHDLCTIPIDVI